MLILISIIIPHFNRSLLLKETIDSVIAQTCRDWEIIIVDDGSEESEFSKIREYENDTNIKVVQRINGIKGPSSCRNFGAGMAKGKYLLFLDSDDQLAPFCLQQRITKMEADDNIELAIFKMFEFNEIPGDSHTIYNKDISRQNWSGFFIRNENPWNVTCPIWKKKFFQYIGGFDEELLFMEDPELHLRAISYPNVQIKVCYDSPADCYYRINNIDGTKQKFWFNSIYYRLLFYRKIISGKYPNGFIAENSDNIKIGIYSLIKVFLYSRKNQFPKLYTDLISIMKESKVFSSFEIMRIATLMSVGNAQSLLLRKMRLKGICYKLLPGK